MCLAKLFGKTIKIEEVKSVNEIEKTDVVMPATGQTAQEYLEELKNTNTQTKKPTKTEAFYLVQKAGGAFDSKSMSCGGTTYQKLTPKAEGHYQYSYNGWLIQYDIRWDKYIDDEGQTLVVPCIEITNIY